MVVAIQFGADGQDMGQVEPELRFGKKEEAFAFLSCGGLVALVLVLGPEGEVAGEFELIVKKPFVPILGKDGVAGWFRIGYIFIVEDGGEPGVFPMPGDFGARLISIRYIIAIFFGFGDTAAAAILQLEEYFGCPGAKGLAYLHKEFADIIAGAEEVGFCFEQEVAGFDQVLAGVAVFPVFEIEGGEVFGVCSGRDRVAEVIVELEVLGFNGGAG